MLLQEQYIDLPSPWSSSQRQIMLISFTACPISEAYWAPDGHRQYQYSVNTGNVQPVSRLLMVFSGIGKYMDLFHHIYTVRKYCFYLIFTFRYGGFVAIHLIPPQQTILPSYCQMCWVRLWSVLNLEICLLTAVCCFISLLEPRKGSIVFSYP